MKIILKDVNLTNIHLTTPNKFGKFSVTLYSPTSDTESLIINTAQKVCLPYSHDVAYAHWMCGVGHKDKTTTYTFTSNIPPKIFNSSNVEIKLPTELANNSEKSHIYGDIQLNILHTSFQNKWGVTGYITAIRIKDWTII